MMQQKKSSAANSWKYLLLFPILLMAWFAFGNPNTSNRNTPFISIITADATEMDLQKTQEVYREVGETLVINELKFNEKDRLTSLSITSIAGNRGKCSSVVDGLESYSYLVYERRSKGSFRCGSSLTTNNFEKIKNPNNWDFIFINGQRPTQKKIDKLIADTKKWRAATKEKLKNASPKTTGTTSYTDLTKEKKAIIKDKIIAAKTTTIYYLDGLKTDKILDDFDYKNIRSVKLNEKHTNYYDPQGALLESLIDTMEVRIISQ